MTDREPRLDAEPEWSARSRPLLGSGGSIRHAHLADLVSRYGSFVSDSLFDEEYELFAAPGLDGVVGFKCALRSVVVVGPPVCAAERQAELFLAFRNFCRSRGRRVIYMSVDEAFARLARDHGCGVLQVATEQLVRCADVVEKAKHGGLSALMRHAAAGGVTIEEYTGRPRDPTLERAAQRVLDDWRRRHSGAMAYTGALAPFRTPDRSRWFLARCDGRVVAWSTLFYSAGRAVHVLDHAVAGADAPPGTTDLLIAEALLRLHADGFEWLDFGAAPARRLSQVSGLSPWASRVVTLGYPLLQRVLPFRHKGMFRAKFGALVDRPLYNVLDPPGLGVGRALANLRALHFSWTAYALDQLHRIGHALGELAARPWRRLRSGRRATGS